MGCDTRKLAKSLSVFLHDMIFEEWHLFWDITVFEVQQALE